MQGNVFRKTSSVRRERRGFTLVEVLVVLAILVILFGLLFAPMMAGMDMATTGRAQARLQDTARLAAEQMRRELANAMYVYPPPTYAANTGAGVVGVTDYSQLVFALPASDAEGAPLTPRQPRTFTGANGPEMIVTRYYVRPPVVDADHEYDESNPFVLMRQEGLYRYNAATRAYEFGSEDSGSFVAGRPMSENRITPAEGYDIPASTTICLDCQAMIVGYVKACTSCDKTNLVYLHDGVKFAPQRVIGEPLVASENNTLFTARHGTWMGTPNNGTIFLPSTALSTADSELQPRLVDYHWVPSEGAYSLIALDSARPNVRDDVSLRWNSTNGTVQVGQWRTVQVHVDVSGTPAAGQFYELTIEGDTYDGNGSRSGGSPAAPIVPIYPKAPTRWDEPRMPIAYRIEPRLSDGRDVLAKLVPQSTWVTVVLTGASDSRRANYTRVSDIHQGELGEYEFSEYLQTDQLNGEVRFDRFAPPSPDQRTGCTALDLYITYYYRRNFDRTAPYRDDALYADYSTGEIINITLIPQRFMDLQPYKDGASNMVVPPDLPLGGAPVRTQAVVENARR